MAEYIDRDAAIAACFDGFADCRDDCAANIRRIPAADVVERKPLPEDVEELVERLQIAAQWAGKVGFRITPSLCLEAAAAIAELSYKYQKALSDLVKQAEPPKEE